MSDPRPEGEQQQPGSSGADPATESGAATQGDPSGGDPAGRPSEGSSQSGEGLPGYTPAADKEQAHRDDAERLAKESE